MHCYLSFEVNAIKIKNLNITYSTELPIFSFLLSVDSTMTLLPVVSQCWGQHLIFSIINRVTISISDFSDFSDRKKELILNFLHWEKQIFIISRQWDTSFVLVFQIIYFELFGFPFTRTAPSLNEIVSITFKFFDPPAIGNIMTN